MALSKRDRGQPTMTRERATLMTPEGVSRADRAVCACNGVRTHKTWRPAQQVACFWGGGGDAPLACREGTTCRRRR
eukprot:59470-Rhodomonas_salina.1